MEYLNHCRNHLFLHRIHMDLYHNIYFLYLYFILLLNCFIY